MDDQSAALRKTMMLDAEWHRADAQFHAACEDRAGVPERARERRARWMKEYHSQPGRRDLRNRRRRASRAAEKTA
jgi:hypothetical protein